MADVAIDLGAHTSTHYLLNRCGVFWTSTTVGYVIFVDSDDDLVYRKTSDGGANWAAKNVLVTGTIRSCDCWADWQTSGDSGTKIHIVCVDLVSNDILYVSLDTSDDSEATDTIEDCQGTGTFADGVSRADSDVSITKTRGGNLAVSFHYRDSEDTSLYGFYTSPDGDTWTSKTNPRENVLDHLLLFPANLADNQDLWAVYWDDSADIISLKTFDNSGNSWSEQSISIYMEESDYYLQMDGAIRISDGHLILAAWSEYDDAAADLKVWDIDGAGSITAKTNVLTNSAQSGFVSLFIGQSTDDIYAAYAKGTALTGLVKVFYKKSDDGAATWGSEAAMQADAEDDERWISCGAVKEEWGGKFLPVWYNDDLLDLFCNTDNGISIAAAGQVHEGAAVLEGAGTLTAVPERTRTGESAVSGAGTVTAAAKRTRTSSLAMPGEGTVAAIGKRIRSVASALAGAGTVAAIGKRVRSVASAPAGAGALTVIANLILAAASAVSGQATLTAIGKRFKLVSSALAGVGTLVIIAALILPSGAALAGAGTLTATGQCTFAGVSALSGEGTLEGIGVRTRPGEAALAGVGTLTASGEAAISAGAVLAGVGAVVGAGKRTRADSAALDGVGTLTGAALVTGALSIDVQVEADLDDVSERSSNGEIIDGSATVIHRADEVAASRFWGAHRFVSGSLPPKGAIITECYAQLHVYSTGEDSPDGHWHFEKAASPLQFALTDYNVTLRSRTTAFANWDENDIGLGWRQTPTLVDVLQEIVDSYSPTALVLIFNPDTGPTSPLYTRPHNYEDGSAAAILHITWKLPVEGAALLSGVGSLTASAINTVSGASAISGQGALGASGLVTRNVAAVLSGEGTVATVAQVTCVGSSTLAGTGTLTASGTIEAPPTLDLQVGAATDDCWRRLTPSSWLLNYAGYLAGAAGASYYQDGGGMRFTNVTIPQGATITNAYLTFRCRATGSVTTVNTRISAEKADNPATLADDRDAFDARWANRTTARVDWDSIPAWTANIDYDSPDIKSVIEEIVQRPGWSSGNALLLFWDDFEDRSTHITQCYRNAWSYDGSVTYAAKLHIEWSAGIEGAAVLEGVGSVTAIGSVTCVGSAALAGEATLTIVGQVFRIGAAALAGEGNLTAAGTLIVEGAAALQGEGQLTASGIIAGAPIEGAAVLSGEGTLVTSAVVTVAGTTTLSGEGQLSVSGQRIRPSGAALSGSSELTILGVVTTSGAAALSGEGQLTVVAGVFSAASATLLGEGSLTVSAAIQKLGAASLLGVGTLVVTMAGQAFEMYVFTRACWDMSVEAKACWDMSVETKPVWDMIIETREDK